MPPRRGIVKSGNAGNSSKTSKSQPAEPNASKENPLFPPGSKYPLSLLVERCRGRCQKEGWEKPSVDTFRRENGWAFAVHLSRINKRTSQRETVRLEPHPPYVRPTAIEARHWGATYALYRFCNGIQLNRVLPPGPREYWNELAAEHKNAPQHQKWMYSSDPFSSQKEVEERQAKATHKCNEEALAAKEPPKPLFTNEFTKVPEVKMAAGLRDLVENAVKRGLSLYPEVAGVSNLLSNVDTKRKLREDLELLGFTSHQSKKAVEFLLTPSPVASSLLASSSPLYAAIEYLVLHVPECDLPKRYLPSTNSSNPFIISGQSGNEDAKKHWIEDKAVKVAGWPACAVKDYLSSARMVENWELLTAALGMRLIGQDFSEGTETAEPYNLDDNEIEALGISNVNSSMLVMPLFSAPVNLHILTCPNKTFPRRGFTPMYMTSTSVPAYIRLHLLGQLLRALQDPNFPAPDEGFCMAAMNILEKEWANIESHGLPEISDVLRYILPPVPDSIFESDPPPRPYEGHSSNVRRADHRSNRNDARSDKQVKKAFERLMGTSQYMEMLGVRERLPSFAARKQFLELVDSHRVVIVVGETGCGKTTQLPQFILDSLILSDHGSSSSILITQPRRVAALSVSARVSAERINDGSVGYAIRGESRYDEKTKLLFCTTGVLLRRLSSKNGLNGISHIIVDEVHERSLDGDFLLLQLKELMKTHLALKIILMSATINHEIFVKYFDGAPLLTIPGFTYPVADMYLEDILSMIDYRPTLLKKQADQEHANMPEGKAADDEVARVIQSISRSNRIDHQLIVSLIGHITSTSQKQGGILVFLPGVQDIRECIKLLLSSVSPDVAIYPLHANLTSDEQRRVFVTTNKWKVIVATNVAETSVTIDDVIYVIDSGKMKEARYDPETGLSRLDETWITKAASRQRRGRAGRTQSGVCYKLYTRNREKEMDDFPVPEILRVPLENTVLSVKATQTDEDVKDFLNKAIDPPRDVAIESALSRLEELGAMNVSGKLTSLGQHIALLPMDIKLAKMLILGAVFLCLDPVLTIAACMSSKPIFRSPIDKHEEANQAKRRFASDSSDLLAALNAYNQAVRLNDEGKSSSAIKDFCDENYISVTTIREITVLRNEFMDALSDIGFVSFRTSPSQPTLNIHSSNINLLKAIILGGLWPRVANVRLPKSAIKFDKVQAGTVQRENTAKEFKMYDLREGRVFLHPSSVLFGVVSWKSPFIAYFDQKMTTKVFIHDATEIPLYAILLFGGSVSVNHIASDLTIGNKDAQIKLKVWPRIGILVNHLRHLLDVQLQQCIDGGTLVNSSQDNPVIEAILALLAHDGMTG